MKKNLALLIHKFPLIYSIVYQTTLFLAHKRRVGNTLRIPAQRRHFRRSTVIASPGHIGFAGGICNPGAVISNDSGLILLAKGQVCHWWDAVGAKADLYYVGSPVVFRLDHEMYATSSHAVKNLDGFSKVGRVGYEDFRMFRYNEEIWVNHSMVPLIKKNACVWTFHETKPCLSRLESDYECLTFLGHPQLDFPVNQIEKNWIYLESDGELLLFYSFSPLRVLKLTDRAELRFSTVINHALPTPLGDIGGYGTMVSFSTNPIEYDENHLLLVVHQIERSRWVDRCYHQWGILLDKISLLPSKYSAKPLFDSLGARGRMAGILYVASVINMNDDFIFFCGEGDAYITRVTVSKKELDELWVNVSQSN